MDKSTNNATKSPLALDTEIWPPLPLSADELQDKWRAGAILHVAGTNTLSRYIIECLTKWQKRTMWENGLNDDSVKCYGSHDAICVMKNRQKGVGEMSAKYGKGIWLPLEDYMKQINDKKVKCWLLYPVGANEQQGKAAAWNWFQYGFNQPYDYLAFVRLFIKSVLMDISDKAAGWEWAYWCTESVAKCWDATGVIVYGKQNPTPLTTEHRCGFNWSPKHEITLEVL